MAGAPLSAKILSEDQIRSLLERARQARLRAYCPYSRFAVGAAVLTAGDCVFVGCNIENAAYSETICAERVALYNAVAAGQRDIVAIAVVAAGLDVPHPCGACLQVIAELAPHAQICMGTPDGVHEVALLPDLLSHPFRLRESGDDLGSGGTR